MEKKNKLIQVVLSLFIFIGFFIIANHLKRTETIPLLLTYSSIFILLFIGLKNSSSLISIFILGILIRGLFLFYIPELSQDFYRFIWDGNIQLLGINPYLYTPDHLIKILGFPNAEILYEGMGSLSTANFSNYPPVSQYLYKIMGYLNRGDLIVPVLSLRIIYFIGEIFVFFLGIKLLKKVNLNPEYMGWYFLNPLVIIEGVGNLHGEAFMLCFTLAAILFLASKKSILGGVFMSLAIGVKLLPLLIIPIFFRYLGIRKFLSFSFSILFFSLLIWSVFLETEMILNYKNTIQLWFNRFEFNGSIYNIIRAIGYEVEGYNIIRKLGKITPFITIGLVIIFSFLRSNRDLKSVFKNMLFLLSCYFFLATTVHPWYIINLVFLGIISGYTYPILWSLTVFWSYSAYGPEGFQEQVSWSLPAYLFVYVCLIWELMVGPLGKHLHKSDFFSIESSPVSSR
ncbi:mannosyltransferase [Flavobacteriaceae bacterium]|nr:mannosyltransferase [Flavobacteriaceae bacterium]